MQAHGQERKLIEQLRKGGLRATNQRLAIMQMLRDSRSHPSAEEIFQRLKRSHPTLSLSTVYKTLQVMADMGTLLTIESGTGSQRFDGQTHPHHHAVCGKCGKIHDVEFEKYPVEPALKDALPGFTVHGVKVVFSGICQSCKSGPASTPTPS